MRRSIACCLIALVLLTGCRQEAEAPADPVAAPAPAPAERGNTAVAAEPSLYDQAQAELKAGQYEAAAKLLEQAVSLDPKDAKAYNDLCFAYIRLEKWQQAIQAAEAALRLDRQNPTVQFNAGRAYLGAGNYSEATDRLSRAYWSNPKNLDAAWFLGVAYEGNRQLVRAQEVYQKALDAAPDDKDFAAAAKRVEAALEAQRQTILRADITGDGTMSEISARPGELRARLASGRDFVLEQGHFDSFEVETVHLGFPVPLLWVQGIPGCPGGREHGIYVYDQDTGQMKELLWHGCATVVNFDKNKQTVSFATRITPSYETTTYRFDGRKLVRLNTDSSLVHHFVWPNNIGPVLTTILQDGRDPGLIMDKAVADAFLKEWAGPDAQVTVTGPRDWKTEFSGELTVSRGGFRAQGSIHMVSEDDLWYIDKLEWIAKP